MWTGITIIKDDMSAQMTLNNESSLTEWFGYYSVDVLGSSNAHNTSYSSFSAVVNIFSAALIGLPSTKVEIQKWVY